MEEISKKQYEIAKEILKTGILRRHEQWLKDLAEIIVRPYDKEIENAYDRSMTITRMARDWYKESNCMEAWYNKSYILGAITNLSAAGFLTDAELQQLNDCKGI